jgi:hypothetical protein
VAADLAATATALANPTDAPSLGDYITAICSAAFRSAPAQESRFLSENVGAMTRMMTGMEIKPSGDVDQDFAAMMIPYHKGAMEMAQAELRHGHNEQVPAPTVLTAWKLAPGQKGTAGDFRHVGTAYPVNVPTTRKTAVRRTRQNSLMLSPLREIFRRQAAETVGVSGRSPPGARPEKTH